MKKTRIGAALIAPLLVAGGCVEPGYELDPSKESRVIDVHFEPAYTRTWTGPPCLLEIDDTCFLNSTYSDKVPDTWDITLQQCDDGFRPREDNECTTRTFEVLEQQFALLSVGNVVRFQGEEIVRVLQ